MVFDYATTQISTAFSERILEYKNILAQIITNSYMADFFNHAGEFDSMSSSAIMRNQIYQALSNYVRMNSHIASAAFVNQSAGMILYQRLGSNDFMSAKLESEKFRQALLEYCDEEYFSDVNIMQAVTLPGAPADTKQYLYFTYPAADLITREVYGVMILEVDNSVFTTVMKPGGNDSILDQYIDANSCVTTPDGTVVFSPAAENIGKSFGGIPNKKSLVVKKTRIRGAPLDLHLLFEYGSLGQFINNFRNIVIASYLIIMVFFAIIIVLVITRITRGSQKIALAIGEFRKTRQESAVEIDKNDELLFTIADQFNMMSGEIEKYIGELNEKNERILQIKDRQRHAEIQALQAQINPHFIYNALDSINWIAIDNAQDKISSMLSGLGSLLRYSISDIDTQVPLRQELEWMQKYVYIQSERFGQSIILSRLIEDGAADFPVYKMLLQPLVENSIIHGFGRDQKDPEIKITARAAANGTLKMRLSDNGRGMERKTLERIKELCRNPGSDNSDNVGISNVVNRLWYYYGPDSEIAVESRPNRGVSFRLTIPRKESSV